MYTVTSDNVSGLDDTLEQSKTRTLTGTAILAALVIVFDYTLKYSGLKIPFPWYPNLKFDFTGTPIVVCLFLYGFSPAVVTCLVAGVGIVARSGVLISASMKVAAELSMVVGLFFGKSLATRVWADDSKVKYVFWLTGLVFRVIVMSVVNLLVLPNVYHVPYEATIGLLPLIGVFNTIQGSLSIGLGFFLYQAIKTRILGWVS